MVKTTKKLLNFLQLLNKYVQKETKKRNLFIRRWLSFGKKWKPQRGRKATAPLHTPRAFFRSSWLWRCEVVDLCMYAAVLDVWGWADVCGCGRRDALLSPGWLGLRGCGGVGVDGEAFLLLLGWGFFLFFACGGVGVTCIVEYWDALYRMFYRIFWKRNDDFLDLCRYSGLCGWWRMYYSGFIGLGNCYRLLLLAARGSYLICIL